MKKYFALFVFALAVLPSWAGMQRHNEQGLSPTHSYKAVGPNEVLSNQNGNLLISEVAADISRTPLGIKVERAYNSHWRDPLITWQMDYDYDKANKLMEDEDGNKGKNIGYKNIDPGTDWYKLEGFGGGAFQDQYYDIEGLSAVPQSWAWAASAAYTMTSGVQTIAQSMGSIVNNHYSEGAPSASLGGDYAMGNVATAAVNNFAVMAIQVMGIVENWDHLSGSGNWEEKTTTAISLTTSSLSMANTWLIGSQSMSNMLSVVGVVMSVYNLQKFQKNSNEWDPGHDAQEFAAFASVGMSVVGLVGTLAGGAAFGPIGAALAISGVVLQVTVMIIAILDMDDNRWDQAEIKARPWALGVNGYVGMVGGKYENELSNPTALTGGAKRWKWTKVRHISTCSGSSSNCVPDTTYTSILKGDSLRSGHPMSELHLVKSDGGAEKFILNELHSIERGDTLFYSFTGLSNRNQTQIYYVDLKPFEKDRKQMFSGKEQGIDTAAAARVPIDNDVNDYYLVKEPNGTWVEFGRDQYKGMRLKTTQWGDPWESYWALPNRIGFFQGDTVSIDRDPASFKITKVRHNNDSRYVEVNYGSGTETIVTKNGSQELDKVVYTFENHRFEDGRQKNCTDRKFTDELAQQVSDGGSSKYGLALGVLANPYAASVGVAFDFWKAYVESRQKKCVNTIVTVPMVTKVTRDVDASKKLVTEYAYADGNLVKTIYPNTSVATYLLDPAKDLSALDGFVQKKAHYTRAGNDSKTHQEWIFAHHGWFSREVKDSLQNPILHTIALTNLFYEDQSREGNTIVEQSQQDNYKFVVKIDARNVGANASYEFDIPADAKGRDPSTVQYITTRTQLVSQTLGAAGDGRHTQFLYNGDQLISQSERQGRDMALPVNLSIYQYDDKGNKILEQINPKDGLSKLRATQLVTEMQSAGVDSATIAGMGTEQLAAWWGTRHVTSLDSLRDEALDQTSMHFYLNDDLAEFYRTDVDTIRQTANSSLDSAYLFKRVVNTSNFKPYGRYVVGLPAGTTQLWLHPDALAQRSGVVGNIVAYESTYLRPLGEYHLIGNVKVPAKRYFYTDAYNPYAQTGVLTFVNKSQCSYESMELDATFHQYPVRKTQYKQLFSCAGGPTVELANVAEPSGLDVSQALVVRMEYDAAGRLQWQQDPSGYYTSYTYDKQDRELSRIHHRTVNALASAGDTIRTAYSDVMDSKGLVQQTETNEVGVKTVANFDGLGRLVRVDRVGKNGGTTSIHSDFGVNGKLMYSRDADGRETFWEYDANARLTAIRTPKAKGDRSYYGEVSVAYDDYKREVTETDELGRRTRFRLNSFGQTVEAERAITLADGVTPDTVRVYSKYDNLGNLVWSKNPKGDTTAYLYNYQAKLAEQMTMDTVTMRNAWSRTGLREQAEVQMVGNPARMDHIDYTYDALGRLLKADVAGDASVDMVWSYDSYSGSVQPGRLLAVQKGLDMLAQYQYNHRGSVTQRHLTHAGNGFAGLDQTAGFDYDAAQNLTALHYPGGGKLQYLFDNFNRLQGIDFYTRSNKKVPVVSHIGYRANDLIDTVAYANGTGLRYHYKDNKPWVDSIVGRKTGETSPIFRQALEYDDLGNIVAQERPRGDRAVYLYDRLNRLANVRYATGDLRGNGNYSYTYDKNGNRESWRYDYGAMDLHWGANNVLDSVGPLNGWPDSWGARKFGWDHRGNMASMRWYTGAGRSAGDVWRLDSLNFNALNELTDYARTQNGQTDAWAFAYDENGWKVLQEQRRDSLHGALAKGREYFVQGVHVLAERGYDSTGRDSLWSHPIPLGNSKVAVVEERAGGLAETQWLYNDHLGNAAMAADAAGNVTMRASLDPYGNVEDKNGGWSTAYLFTGKEMVPGLGLYYFGARWYDPELGMWLGRDPAGQFESPYVYAGNGLNPVNAVDENGKELAGAFIGAVSGFVITAPTLSDPTLSAMQMAQILGVATLGGAMMGLVDPSFGALTVAAYMGIGSFGTSLTISNIKQGHADYSDDLLLNAGGDAFFSAMSAGMLRKVQNVVKADLTATIRKKGIPGMEMVREIDTMNENVGSFFTSLETSVSIYSTTLNEMFCKDN
jgi:RHS repeat-associated protein